MISFRLILGFLFVLLMATIAVLAVVCYENNHKTAIAYSRVNQAHQVIQKADEVSMRYKDARLSVNRMIITGDTSRYADYITNVGKLSSALNELRRLTIDNRSQRFDIDSVEYGLRRYQAMSDSLVRLVRTKQPVALITNVFSNSISLRDDLTIRIGKVKDAENILLVKYEALHRNSLADFTDTLNLLLIATVTLLAAVFFVVRYNFNKRKRAEYKLKQALSAEVELNRLKSNFVTMASHEFRTPLTTILSSAFLLENYMSGEAEGKAKKHLARIKSSVNNLTSILDEFLSVSRLEEGQIHPNMEKTDLPKYLQDVCNDLQTFARPGQVIHYEHKGEHEINTDPVLLGNIVRNIVTNSIKYSPENSTIQVSSNVNSRVHVSVSDNGIGISPADQKHLFERFYRASNAGAVQGTGLGLYIMKYYVNMLKGSVKLESELGKGTKVDVTFEHQ